MKLTKKQMKERKDRRAWLCVVAVSELSGRDFALSDETLEKYIKKGWKIADAVMRNEETSEGKSK